MVPVLGRVASGMWQVARAELQQDLDSPQIEGVTRGPGFYHGTARAN